MPDISSIKVDGVIYTIKDTVARQNAGITVDTAMSDTSEAAVQNKVIKSYVDTALADRPTTTEVTTEIQTTVETVVEEKVDQAIADKMTDATQDDLNALFP